MKVFILLCLFFLRVVNISKGDSKEKNELDDFPEDTIYPYDAFDLGFKQFLQKFHPELIANLDEKESSSYSSESKSSDEAKRQDSSTSESERISLVSKSVSHSAESKHSDKEVSQSKAASDAIESSEKYDSRIESVASNEKTVQSSFTEEEESESRKISGEKVTDSKRFDDQLVSSEQYQDDNSNLSDDAQHSEGTEEIIAESITVTSSSERKASEVETESARVDSDGSKDDEIYTKEVNVFSVSSETIERIEIQSASFSSGDYEMVDSLNESDDKEREELSMSKYSLSEEKGEDNFEGILGDQISILGDDLEFDDGMILQDTCFVDSQMLANDESGIIEDSGVTEELTKLEHQKVIKIVRTQLEESYTHLELIKKKLMRKTNNVMDELNHVIADLEFLCDKICLEIPAKHLVTNIKSK